MFPHAENSPAVGFKQAPDFRVALNIPADLCSPERRVGLWRNAVNGTRMPEASVDEEHDACGHECEVGPARKAAMKAIAEAFLP